jgi:hypothetical protein
VTGGWQFANATVTKFPPEPQLIGKWIPEVPRNMATTQVRFTRPRAGLLSIQGRMSGHEFDDDLNNLLLRSYFRLDAFSEHRVNQRVVVFASGENLLDRTIQVGRTPLLTLGTPRIVHVGVRLAFGD